MHSDFNPILVLLGQIGLILLLSRIMGLIFGALKQPQVIGEMVAGIMLGPSLLGWLAPDVSAAIFPVESIPYLNILSQLGVIFFLFLIGLELDPKLIRNRGHAAVVISHASIVVPFLMGAGLALYLYPRLFNASMPFTPVALFMGAAMSITAFPVLARILTERNLHKSTIGAVTITCAAVDDVTAWCMLAVVVGVAKSNALEPGLLTAGYSLVYVAVMFFVIKPFLVRLQQIYERQGRLSHGMVAIIFLLVLGSAFATELIGIHALFGAFLMGAIMPKGTQFVRHLSEKLEDYTVVLLLPIFFAYTGLKTSIGLINNADMLFDTLLILLVACAGKFGGSALAARACGFGWRESGAIGILMNTRGLMELVILNIGRELGVISEAVFAMMVIMALVTTALTTPILSLVYPRRLLMEEEEALQPTPARGFGLLIPVANPQSGGQLLKLADMIVEPAEDNRVYALHLRRPIDREAYRTGLQDSPADDAPLVALLNQPHAVPVRPISFVSRDVPEDIVRVSENWNVDLILMGFHKPVFSSTILGGAVHRVMNAAPCDVAVFVDRGFKKARTILVPFLGGPHDQLAMSIASRMARNIGAAVTVLHVVQPSRGADASLGAKQATDRVFQDPTQPTPVTFRIIANDAPVDVVLAEATKFDLVIIGIGEEWGLESHLFGFRPEKIVEDSPASLLIVRSHQSPT